MSMQFDATYYMDVRPDVLAAYVNSGAEAGTGLTWAAFAEQHYNDFGWKEGYNPNAIFDTSEYLAANIDVLNAGVNPFEHYLTHGVNEGRAPNASFPKFADFDADAYLAANSDLGEAGIETAEEAYAHFVMHGQFEDRPGAPVVEDPATKGETNNLTIGVDEFTGTAKNDTFNAVPVNPANSDKATTLNAWDSIDGGDGVDTLNIYTDFEGDKLFNTEQQGTVKNIEIINIHNKAGAVFGSGATDGIDASKFEGSQQIWQNGAATDVSKVGSQTIGFRGTDANKGGNPITVAAAASATSIAIALDKAGAATEADAAEVALSLEGAKVNTVSISGSIGDDGEGGKLFLTALPAKVETLNLAMDTDTSIEGKDDQFGSIKVLNAADSSGGLTAHLIALDGELALESASFGSGNDVVTLANAQLKADATSISLGGGNDLLGLIVVGDFDGDEELDGVEGKADIAVNAGDGNDRIILMQLEDSESNITLTGGAGGDTFTIVGRNVAFEFDDETEVGFAEGMGFLTITDFGNGKDVIELYDFEDFSSSFAAENAVENAIEALDDDATLFDAYQAALSVIKNPNETSSYAQFAFGDSTYLVGDELLVDLNGSVLSAVNVTSVTPFPEDWIG